LDIVETKKGEPVRYGDTIMLMHENSQKFLKYDPKTKKLILSNHDSEYTLFMIEQKCEIMTNNDQILKAGQPIKLKLASFEEANKNLYLSLNFPMQKYNDSDDSDNEVEKDDEFMTTESKMTNKRQTQTVKSNLRLTTLFGSKPLKHNIKKYKSELKVKDVFESGHRYEESYFSEDEEEDKKILEDEILDFAQENYYNEDKKLYKVEPIVNFEEQSQMSWRFNIYSSFTTDESLISYGDHISILHYQSSGYLTVGNKIFNSFIIY